MNRPPYADLNEMRAWARDVMAREPDFIIGDNYIRRWWVVPRNEWCSVYLHEILHSDDDRAFHDHPWENTSFLISGCYIEHTPEGQFMRVAGDTIKRGAESLHRIEVVPGKPAVSLFITGPRVRDWGFDCPQGWVPWQQFVEQKDKGKIGRGCGE